MKGLFVYPSARSATKVASQINGRGIFEQDKLSKYRHRNSRSLEPIRLEREREVKEGEENE